MKFSYAKSVHEQIAEQVFTDLDNVVSAQAPAPCLLIGFVNRSGSNYLGELLRSTGGFVGLEEPLNDYSLRVLSEKFQVNQFSLYLERLRSEQMRYCGQLWGMKVGWLQLVLLLRTQAIPRLLTPRMVIVKRRDLIGQAVSLYIAERTAQWTAAEPAKIGRDSVEYDGQKILNTLRGIMQSYNALEQVALLAAIPITEVIYEELSDNPISEIAKLTRAICGRALGPELQAVKLRVQRDELNEQLKRRFLKDLPTMEWEGC